MAPSRQALIGYWRKIARRALPYLARRPLKLVRHEDGIVFYHEGAGPLPPMPVPVHRLTIQKREGGRGLRLWIDSLEGLLGLVEMDVVEIHPWGATIDDIEHPDLLVFDLQPGAGAGWDLVLEGAVELRELLSSEGLESWPKLGAEGDLHVLVRVEPSLTWDAARAYCKMLAEELVSRHAAKYTTRSGAENRAGKIYIDYLRNGRGSTAIGAYSPIARKGFPVAVPLTWGDVQNGAKPDAYTMVHPFGEE